MGINSTRNHPFVQQESEGGERRKKIIKESFMHHFRTSLHRDPLHHISVSECSSSFAVDDDPNMTLQIIRLFYLDFLLGVTIHYVDYSDTVPLSLLTVSSSLSSLSFGSMNVDGTPGVVSTMIIIRSSLSTIFR